jgi:transposase
LAVRLGMPASPDSLLRTIRRTVLPPCADTQVLGVDEWAFRRGHHYGAILCDLERHRVVDLLPDRSSELVAVWLAARPGVKVITRDRANYFAKGAAVGAPEAIQIADRWHLLRNARDVLARVAER